MTMTVGHISDDDDDDNFIGHISKSKDVSDDDDGDNWSRI